MSFPLCPGVLVGSELLADTDGEMKGTSTVVDWGFSGTSGPKEYGGSTSGLLSFKAVSFDFFLYLKIMPMNRIIPKTRLPPASRNV